MDIRSILNSPQSADHALQLQSSFAAITGAVAEERVVCDKSNEHAKFTTSLNTQVDATSKALIATTGVQQTLVLEHEDAGASRLRARSAEKSLISADFETRQFSNNYTNTHRKSAVLTNDTLHKLWNTPPRIHHQPPPPIPRARKSAQPRRALHQVQLPSPALPELPPFSSHPFYNMKRAADTAPTGRQRKRTPMRSAGAPVPSTVSYAQTSDGTGDVFEEDIMEQSYPPPPPPSAPHLQSAQFVLSSGRQLARSSSQRASRSNFNSNARMDSHVYSNGSPYQLMDSDIPPNGENFTTNNKSLPYSSFDPKSIEIANGGDVGSPSHGNTTNGYARPNGVSRSNRNGSTNSAPFRRSGMSSGASSSSGSRNYPSNNAPTAGPSSRRKPRYTKPSPPATPSAGKFSHAERTSASLTIASTIAADAHESVTGAATMSIPLTLPTSTVNSEITPHVSGANGTTVPLKVEPAPPKKKKPKRVRKKKVQPPDPNVPYPNFEPTLGNIPSESIGDFLQVYDFCSAFSKTLALSPFKLRSFELALSIQEQTPLVDAIVVRLVRTILNDKALCNELQLSAKIIGSLRSGKSAGAAEKTLKGLADLFRTGEMESEGIDQNDFLYVVEKLKAERNSMAFYEILSTKERLQILRELVDYASSSEIVRVCVTNSIEFEDEARKKAREELSSQRGANDVQLRELRAELQSFREKHGLLTGAAAAAAEAARQKEEAEKAAAEAASSSKGKRGSKSKSKSASKAAPARPPSRKDRMRSAKKAREEAERRKVIERTEDALVQKIEKVRSTAKVLKERAMKINGIKREIPTGVDLSAQELAELQLGVEADKDVDRAERNEEDPVRMHPLGRDRVHRRYWYIPGSGRLWVEDTATHMWMSTENSHLLDDLLSWCSPHRKEERYLKTVLNLRQQAIVDDMRLLAKTKEKEIEARDRKQSAPRTRAGSRRARESIGSGSTSMRDASVEPYMSYRNTLAEASKS